MTQPSRLALLLLALCPAARADEGADRAQIRARHDVLADQVQVGLRSETAFGIGRHDRIANVTALEPSFLTMVGDAWGLAHRFSLPLVWQPEVVARYGGTYGLGDVGYELYAARPSSEGLSLGGGLALLLPTGSDRRLSDGKWGAGPALALGYAWGPASLSLTARQLFTLGSTRTAPDLNRLLLQPSFTWALRSGWYLLAAPALRADWGADSSDRFTVPLGGGVGRVFGIASQRVALTLEGYVLAAPRSRTPHPDWTLRAGIALLYPR